MAQNRREQALALADEVLADIELSRIPAPDIVKKASRLARLLDDTDAMAWLRYEVEGYPQDGLDREAVAAAIRSRREAPSEDDGPRYWTSSLSQLQGAVDARKIALQSAVDRPVSLSSANPNQHVAAPSSNRYERGQLANSIAENTGLIDRIIGAIHTYVNEREVELRFGAAVESAFTIVRNRVDARIARLAPSAATKFAAAFENASSGNPEHWANAASECRRILKAIADELRPAGEPVNGRPMTDDKYINRLVDWIVTQKAIGGTTRDVVTSDLADFGKRIDAFDDAGHKGAHAEVTQYEASRFITGAYLLIGDILDLWAEVQEAEAEVTVEAEATADAEVKPAVPAGEPTGDRDE